MGFSIVETDSERLIRPGQMKDKAMDEELVTILENGLKRLQVDGAKDGRDQQYPPCDDRVE